MLVLLNPSACSGAARGCYERLDAALKAHGLSAEIVQLGDGMDVTDVVRGAVARGHTTIVAGGGDGTINSVASAILDMGVTLGVLPLGTRNHFARDLGLPPDLEGAVGVLARGEVRSIDVGEVNGHTFVNNSALGLYPYIVELRERQRAARGWSKMTAFFFAAITALRRYPYLGVRLDMAGGALAARTRSVFVGNNVYELVGRDLGCRSRLDEGKLCIYVTRHLSRLRLLAMAAGALFGRAPTREELHAVAAPEVWIHTRHRRPHVALDGEVRRLAAPLHYRLRPLALRVVAP